MMEVEWERKLESAHMMDKSLNGLGATAGPLSPAVPYVSCSKEENGGACVRTGE